jgi:exosome complex component RRP46
MELPKLNASLECLTKSDGSAKLSINENEQLCAIYGPGEVKIAKELADRAYLNITYKPRIGQISNQEKVIEYSIKSICDGSILTTMHPRTSINIILQEVQTTTDENNQQNQNRLACAINCVCLALLDASIPLKFSFASVCCSLTKTQDIIYFPTGKQQQDKNTLLTATFVFDSVENDLIFVNTNGIFEINNFNYLLLKAKDYCVNHLFTYFNKCISNKLENLF